MQTGREKVGIPRGCARGQKYHHKVSGDNKAPISRFEIYVTMICCNRSTHKAICSTLLQGRRYLSSSNDMLVHSGRSGTQRMQNQTRLANLGDVIDKIKLTMPDILHSQFPREIISDDITLRILPETHPNIPSFHGRVTATSAIKVLQLFASTVLLPPGGSQVAILSSRLSYRFTAENSVKDAPPNFFIRWRTCNSADSSSVNSYPSSFSSRGTSQLSRMLQLLPHEYPVLTGILEFQFNHQCTEVTVLTLNDLEYISRPVDCAEPV
ncbi:hypothetical protein TRVA0_006S01706 [Trichomonascus vanleenenianus]|uniref:Mco32p n=1 Tax=Trichomonascus vanleenenianus TaxID=2268995 RepID=UPI003ECA3C27